jgi:hypothetical protein
MFPSICPLLNSKKIAKNIENHRGITSMQTIKSFHNSSKLILFVPSALMVLMSKYYCSISYGTSGVDVQ